MDYIAIEKTLINYIINLIGPNQHQNELRENKFNIIKKIVLETFSNLEDIQGHIFYFGSFPMKTYLPDSDLDITVLLSHKKNGKPYANYSYDSFNEYDIVIILDLS